MRAHRKGSFGSIRLTILDVVRFVENDAVPGRRPIIVRTSAREKSATTNSPFDLVQDRIFLHELAFASEALVLSTEV